MTKYQHEDLSALQNFKGCHNRVRDGKVNKIEWPRTNDGYAAFLKEIGPKPKDWQKWSVGRIKHNLGYVTGNIQWELHRFNSVKRKGTKHEKATEPTVELRQLKFKRGSKEYLEHQKRISREYWSQPEVRRKRSRLLKKLWQEGAFNNRRSKNESIND